MWPSFFEFLAILVMASTTYFTRVVGFLYLRKYQLNSKMKAVLEASPCCVMISVVAPYFLTNDWKMLASLVFASIIAFRFNLAITICTSVAFMALLQNIFV